MEHQIRAAAEYIRSRTSLQPKIGMVLGSGLGNFADTLTDAIRIPFSEIPNFPRTSVEGHAGALVIGRKGRRAIAVLQGRVHYYEGRSQKEITLPIRVMAALGISTLILTNAAGGINTAYRPGDLMLICDHINLSGSNPLIGPNLDSFGPRFPDMTDLYNADLRAGIKEMAGFWGVRLREGIYAMCAGPNYETPAEVRMLRTLGADAVGMSTVPEALVAGHCGMKVIGISCITNMAAGVLPRKLSHDEVIETAAKAHGDFHNLLNNLLTVL
ncbi:MAG: purine-nucleoside phosphorylase [Clostridia bacterium]|nr:purine-nucleoside phosphorylase [Clostridia bacterium]